MYQKRRRRLKGMTPLGGLYSAMCVLCICRVFCSSRYDCLHKKILIFSLSVSKINKSFLFFSHHAHIIFFGCYIVVGIPHIRSMKLIIVSSSSTSQNISEHIFYAFCYISKIFEPSLDICKV